MGKKIENWAEVVIISVFVAGMIIAGVYMALDYSGHESRIESLERFQNWTYLDSMNQSRMQIQGLNILAERARIDENNIQTLQNEISLLKEACLREK